MKALTHCTLCPRRCGTNRSQASGLCGAGHTLRIARAAPHFWEEPCISGSHGSGTVFFSGCPLRCSFCQNHKISHQNFGREVTVAQLADSFLRLQHEGVNNLNLVTGTQYTPWILEALDTAKSKGLSLPVVWNTSGYETPETIALLAPFIDIWLADLKFFSPALAQTLAAAPDYFAAASRAVVRMGQLAGPPRFDEHGLMMSGLIVRLLVLPGQRQDAKDLLHWMAEHLPQGGFLLSLMRQYIPPASLTLPPSFNRKLASFEYNDVLKTALALGLDTGYTQGKESAQQAYTPPFDLSGV